MSADIILKPALKWSGYLRRYLNAWPDQKKQLIVDAEQIVNRTTINNWFEELNSNKNNNIQFILRKLRQRVFTTLMVRDLNQQAVLHEVVAAMSYFAELAVAQAYKSAMQELMERHGEPICNGQPQDMLILGMGKLGGTELNVSSDIDLVMLYGVEGQTNGVKPISHSEFYAKVCRRMTAILSDADENGIVFRTDLRLRPDGANGLLAWNLDALKNYLLYQGREWERYAWLKARLIQCPIFDQQLYTDQAYLLQSLRQPFVYRKYLDFDALAALRDLRQRIRLDWQRRANSRTGIDTSHNIKLGEGGIREIEFVIQLNQLIRGGRRPSLQQRNLIAAIHKQRRAGILNEAQASSLHEAYMFLRRLEHILQYKEDEQTHLLPHDNNEMISLAEAFGSENLDQFQHELTQHRQFVAQCFRDAFRIAGLQEEKTQTIATTQKSQNNQLDDAQNQQIQNHIKNLLASHRIRSLPTHSRKRVENLLPKFKQAAINTLDPVNTLLRLLSLLEHIAQRSSYLALLDEYPQTTARIARIVSASTWASQFLTQYPLLLDSLIEWHSLMQEPDFRQIAEQLSNDLDACLLPDGQADIEQQMNLMRDLQHRITFQLLAQDLENIISVESLADHLSALADLLLGETINRVWPTVNKSKTNQNTQKPDSPKFAIIAYGKLGGKELGYASDLDLVFLYDDPDQNASDTYVRLGRRVASWLSTMTSSGRLYEIDLRLRPDGDAGLLAIPIDSFESYQLNQAWSWEHQALTRARFVAGDLEIGQRFEDIRKRILLLPRNPNTLRTEVLEMRERIFKGHPNKSELFDIKHDQGGMVDIEFITQFLVLNNAGQHPELIGNLGNIALLGLAAKAGLIPELLATEVADIYRFFRREQHSIRLQGADKARVDTSKFTHERQVVQKLWQQVFELNSGS